MARYIDADLILDDMKAELKKATKENLTEDEAKVIMTSAIALKDFVNRQPTADVVEVVRCHNCEYHCIRDKCPLLNMSPYRDDERGYCSEGKRLE